MAAIASDWGDDATAEARYREALALQLAALGPDHPDVASTRSNLGMTLAEAGRPSTPSPSSARPSPSPNAASPPTTPSAASTNSTSPT